jgi:uncharacterized protein YukE
MTARANDAGGLDARSLRDEIEQLRSQLAEANEAAAQNTRTLKEEIEQLRTGIERERSKRFVNRVVEAAQRTQPLRDEIEQLRSQLEEANEAVGQDRGRLEENIKHLSAELQRERERGFFRKLFGLGPRPSEDTEQFREKMRGRLAVRLVWALLAVVVGTFAYLWFSNLSPTELNNVVPMVGTTLLTPLVGLIGAVMGFYYGGQTAVQAASQTAEATRTAAQAATTVQSATAAQITAQTAAQKATTSPQSADAARTAADMYAQTAAQMTNGANGTNRPLGSSTVRSQTQLRRGGRSSNSP